MSAPPEPGTLRTSRSRVVAAWIGTALLLGACMKKAFGL